MFLANERLLFSSWECFQKQYPLFNNCDVTCSDQTFVKLSVEHMEVLMEEHLLEPLIAHKKFTCKCYLFAVAASYICRVAEFYSVGRRIINMCRYILPQTRNRSVPFFCKIFLFIVLVLVLLFNTSEYMVVENLKLKCGQLCSVFPSFTGVGRVSAYQYV